MLFGGFMTWAAITAVIALARPTDANATNGSEDPRWLVITATAGIVIGGAAIVVGVLGLLRAGRQRSVLRVSPWRRTRATYVEVHRFGGQAAERRVGIVAHDLGFGDPTVISLRWNTWLVLGRSGLAGQDWADVSGDPRTGFVVRGPEKTVLLSGRLLKGRIASLLIEATAAPPGSKFGRSGYHRRR